MIVCGANLSSQNDAYHVTAERSWIMGNENKERSVRATELAELIYMLATHHTVVGCRRQDAGSVDERLCEA
jgi:hypothetical protein